jgi:hypothetical protein
MKSPQLILTMLIAASALAEEQPVPYTLFFYTLTVCPAETFKLPESVHAYAMKIKGTNDTTCIASLSYSFTKSNEAFDKSQVPNDLASRMSYPDIRPTEAKNIHAKLIRGKPCVIEVKYPTPGPYSELEEHRASIFAATLLYRSGAAVLFSRVLLHHFTKDSLQKWCANKKWWEGEGEYPSVEDTNY